MSIKSLVDNEISEREWEKRAIRTVRKIAFGSMAYGVGTSVLTPVLYHELIGCRVWLRPPPFDTARSRDF